METTPDWRLRIERVIRKARELGDEESMGEWMAESGELMLRMWEEQAKQVRRDRMQREVAKRQRRRCPPARGTRTN